MKAKKMRTKKKIDTIGVTQMRYPDNFSDVLIPTFNFIFFLD